MAISLTVGDADALSLSGAKELLAAARATDLKLGPEFKDFLKQPLSAVPPQMCRTAVGYTAGGASWTPGGGTLGGSAATAPDAAIMPGTSPLTFTLSGGVCGKIAVVTGGNLLTYTDGFPTTVNTSLSLAPQHDNRKAIAVGEGEAYVTLELDFQLSGGITGSYQQGIYGVSTADSASSAISVAFYKRCTTSTTLEDGLRQAFEGFVLPLHNKTLEQIEPGDYLHYNFNGNLQLGLGASIGYDKVLYAATTTQALPRTNGALSLTASAAPELQAGVKFSFAYEYGGSFEMLLWRDAGDQMQLHLYRAKTQTIREGANIGISLLSGSSASGAVSLSQVTSLFTGSMPPALQSTFSSKVLPAAQGAMGDFVGELNDKVTGWLSKANSEFASLDLAITRRSDSFLLTDCTIDLSNPKHGDAWKLMLGGRFLDAIELAGAGVTLATGSGLEALYSKEAAIKLNLFGALHSSWTETTLNNASLVYAGNNVFHLVTVEGKDVLAAMNATSHEVALYFAAEADLSDAGAAIALPKLHCLLRAVRNSNFGAAIGKLAGLLSPGPEVAALADALTKAAQQPGGAVTLHLIFEPEAYSQLDAATIQRGRPDDELKDTKNYQAFQSACAAVYGSGPASLFWQGHPLNYGLWRDAWRASNDQWPAADGSLPDRREHAGFNPYVMSQLGEAVPGLSGSEGEAQLVFYALSAAAQFMNFCDDLRILASQTTAYTPQTWKSFVDELAAMVKNDVNTDFTSATVLALANLCGQAPSTVSGPTPELPPGKSMGVTMTYGS